MQVWFLIGIWIRTCICQTTTQVELINNSYSKIIIGIAENIAEDTTIIDRLKTILTAASAAMYTATR